MNSKSFNGGTLPLTEMIKAEAHALGFFACGVAKAGPVDSTVAAAFHKWISGGKHAGMAYMAANDDKRLDPRLLQPGTKSIVCVALNYAPPERMADGEYQIAAYAYGKDYHDIMKAKLHSLAGRIQDITDAPLRYRAFCDTAPVLERYWAVRAGLGWTGHNRQLIIPGAGSMFFLGELFLDIELDYDRPMPGRCGTCRACTDACPTKALSDTGLDARLCLSYQTIENRGELSPAAANALGNRIYGCDRCQQACPWNRFSVPCDETELHPSPALLSMTKEKWNSLSADDYRRLFKGSAVKRAGYEGLTRNIRAAAENEKRRASNK